MATRYGMETEIGQASFITDRPRYLDLPGLGPQPSEISEETSAKIDATIRNLIDGAFQRASEILRICANAHQGAAVRLLDKETFNEGDLEPIRAAIKGRLEEAEQARKKAESQEPAAPTSAETSMKEDFESLKEVSMRILSGLLNRSGFRSAKL